MSLFGPEAPLEFGRFEQAFVTMFRLTTDGQWPLSIAQYDEEGGVNWKCAAFMMSYIVCINWVVLQARATPPAAATNHAFAPRATSVPRRRVARHGRRAVALCLRGIRLRVTDAEFCVHITLHLS